MRVAVVYGGASLEAEVSRASAEAVGAALGKSGHLARLLVLDAGLAAALLAAPPDVVFPVAHGALGEDGCLQGLLEVLELPYVGSGVLASALAADKAATKMVYRTHGLPVAADMVVQRGSAPQLEAVRQTLGPDFIVKPVSGGSSFGVSRIMRTASEVDYRTALEQAMAHGPALLETLVFGTELTCGVLETDGAFAPLPPTQVDAQAGEFYDYRSKYAAGGSVHHCPAQLPPQTTQAVQALAVRAHQALGARDLSRTDMILGPGNELTLLETNTLPGMTNVSLFPEAAGVAGIPLSHLVDQLVQAAKGRALTRPARASGVALPSPFA